MGAAKREYVPVEARVAVEGMKETPSAVEHGGCVAKNFFVGVMLVCAARTDFLCVFTGSRSGRCWPRSRGRASCEGEGGGGVVDAGGLGRRYVGTDVS